VSRPARPKLRLMRIFIYRYARLISFPPLSVPSPFPVIRTIFGLSTDPPLPGSSVSLMGAAPDTSFFFAVRPAGLPDSLGVVSPFPFPSRRPPLGGGVFTQTLARHLPPSPLSASVGPSLPSSIFSHPPRSMDPLRWGERHHVPPPRCSETPNLLYIHWSLTFLLLIVFSRRKKPELFRFSFCQGTGGRTGVMHKG